MVLKILFNILFSSPRCWYGWHPDIVERLARDLNFTYEYVIPSDMTYGGFNEVRGIRHCHRVVFFGRAFKLCWRSNIVNWNVRSCKSRIFSLVYPLYIKVIIVLVH